MSGKKHANRVRACLITSERSGSGRFQLEEVLPVLVAQGWDVAVREKREKGDAIELARRAAREGYDPIVNCGGDGTLNEIVQALAGTDVAVGSIPGGTVNVWSKEVGISLRSRVAALQLVTSRRAQVDLGCVDIDGKHRHHFVMMAGLGADATVMDRVSRSLKTRLGPLAVGAAAIESVPALKAVVVELRLDDTVWRGPVSEIVVGNTRRYGGFTSITPQAYADDALLDICIFTTDGTLGTLRQLTSLLVRQRPSEASAEFYRVARLSVRSEAILPLQIDGSKVKLPDGDHETRYDFSVIPQGLTVLLPRTYDGAIFAHGLSSNGHQAKKGKEKKVKFKKG